MKSTNVQLTLLKSSQPAQTEMLGVSNQMRELISDIERAARSTHVVLIMGETGTGKTTAAYMIHERSARATKPFVDINCAAIPDTLIESELFGYERGAFTGAIASKQGLFEVANRGTLFLDEVEELKLELQAKLLTAIERQKIRRIGGTAEIECDVRIIAASSCDLQRMVVEKKFREDLYYRLDVLEIPIPPLRDRSVDIPILVRDRLIREQKRSAIPRIIEIEDAAIEQLTAYEWPGNIRQLHNVIARLTTRIENGMPITARAVSKEISRFKDVPKEATQSVVTAECAFNDIGVPQDNQSIVLPPECCMLWPDESLHEYTKRVKRHVIETVRDYTGNMTAASVRLKYHRTALSSLLSQLRDNRLKQPRIRMHRARFIGTGQFPPD